MSLSHQTAQEQIQSSAKLTQAEHAALEDHLRTCAECRAYAELHHLLLGTLLDAHPTQRYSEREIRAKIGQVSSRLERRRWPMHFFKHTLSLAGIGAVLALLLIIFFSVPRMMPAQPELNRAPNRDSAGIPGISQDRPTAGGVQPTAAMASAAVEEMADRTTRPTHAPVFIAPAPSATGSPAAPQSAPVGAVAVQGQIAYTGIGTRLVAFDISHADAPEMSAQSAELPGKVIKIFSFVNQTSLRVVVAAGRSLVLFDHSDAKDLSLVSQSKLPGPVHALILDLSSGWIYAGGSLQSDASKGFVAALDTAPADHLELLQTTQLPAPVQSLALSKSVLYIALRGDQPQVATISLAGGHFGAVKEAIHGVAVSSMTAAGDLLYLGVEGKMLAYDLAKAEQPLYTWQITQVGDARIPGMISGFVVLPNAILATGLDGAGNAFRVALTPPETLKTGSVVDTASCLAVSAGQLVVASERLEIYDSRDPRHLKLIGSHKLVLP